MGKILVIAAREYRAIVGTKAFLIAIIMMPILMGGGIAVQVLLRDRLGPTERKIMVLDCPARCTTNWPRSRQKNETKNIVDEHKQIGPPIRAAGPCRLQT